MRAGSPWVWGVPAVATVPKRLRTALHDPRQLFDNGDRSLAAVPPYTHTRMCRRRASCMLRVHVHVRVAGAHIHIHMHVHVACACACACACARVRQAPAVVHGHAHCGRFRPYMGRFFPILLTRLGPDSQQRYQRGRDPLIMCATVDRALREASGKGRPAYEKIRRGLGALAHAATPCGPRGCCTTPWDAGCHPTHVGCRLPPLAA